ncbi:MAG: alanine racemase [Thermoplasmatota archaeon]
MSPNMEASVQACGSWIELDASALRHNLSVLREEMAPAALCMVVKANAYGHGYSPMVEMAEAAGQRLFAVFSAREAAGFYRASDGQSRLMVMGYTHDADVPWLLGRNAEFWVNDPEDVAKFAAHAEATNAVGRVHLEVETGMNRTGVPLQDAFELAERIHAHPNLELQGVCTHLAGAEDRANLPRLSKQRERFEAFVGQLRDAGLEVEAHLSSSASAILDEASRYDLVRTGIACYGHWPSTQVREQREKKFTLKRVMSWKSVVMSVHDVRDGDMVGYGGSFEAEGDTKVAVVPVGYVDGLARDLSNRGHVLIDGRRASIVGPVNMNMMQVHVSHIPDISPGDEVVLIGNSGNREIGVSSFADFSGSMTYEMMARLSVEIPRIVKGEATPG